MFPLRGGACLMWAAWMLLGGFALKAFQVCRIGMLEMDELDVSDDSWASVMDTYDASL